MPQRVSPKIVAHYLIFGFGYMFQQSPTTPSVTPGMSFWEQPAVIGALVVVAGLILNAVGKDGAMMIHQLALSGKEYLQNAGQARRIKTDALQTQIEQNKALFTQLAEMAKVAQETQRLSNEQHAQHQAEKAEWAKSQEEFKREQAEARAEWSTQLNAVLETNRQMAESNQVSAAAVEAVVAENKTLKERLEKAEKERDELAQQNAKLQAELETYKSSPAIPPSLPPLPTE